MNDKKVIPLRLLKSKNAKLKFDPSKTGGMITSIILLVLALRVFAVGLPEMGEAGNEVGDTGYELTSLFNSDSVLILAIVGGVLVAIVLQVIPGKGK